MKLARWTMLLGTLAVGGALVAVSAWTGDRLRGLLAGSERGQPPEVLPVPRPALPGTAGAGEGSDTGVLDLEHPTERDWRFLGRVLREGSPEARRSAARALLESGYLRGAPLLLEQARPGEPDAELFCLAALEILRFQRREDALAVIVQALQDGSHPLELSCRAELSDRFHLLGGDEPEVVAGLAGRPEPLVRAYAARYLASLPGEQYRELLERLAGDEDPAVREAAAAALGAGSGGAP